MKACLRRNGVEPRCRLVPPTSCTACLVVGCRPQLAQPRRPTGGGAAVAGGGTLVLRPPVAVATRTAIFLSDVEVNALEMTKIIMQQKSVVDLRFSISRDFFPNPRPTSTSASLSWDCNPRGARGARHLKNREQSHHCSPHQPATTEVGVLAMGVVAGVAWAVAEEEGVVVAEALAGVELAAEPWSEVEAAAEVAPWVDDTQAEVDDTQVEVEVVLAVQGRSHSMLEAEHIHEMPYSLVGYSSFELFSSFVCLHLLQRMH